MKIDFIEFVEITNIRNNCLFKCCDGLVTGVRKRKENDGLDVKCSIGEDVTIIMKILKISAESSFLL